MPDQADAEILQILGRQARQYSCVDLVRAERRLVVLEPEAAQPFAYIHCAALAPDQSREKAG